MSSQSFDISTARNALILSRGGTLGMCFETGFLNAVDQRGFSFDIVGGISAGAVVGAMYATGQIQTLAKIIKEDLTQEMVFSSRVIRNGKVSYWGALLSLRKLITSEGLVDPSPLVGLLAQYMQKEKLEKHLMIGVHSAGSGDYSCIDVDYCLTDIGFANLVRASMSISGVFPPVENIRTEVGDFRWCVDPGFRKALPLGDIVDAVKGMEGKYNLTILSGEYLGAAGLRDKPKNWMETALLSVVDGIKSQIFDDVRILKHRNNLPMYEAFESVLVSPPFDLGFPLTFDRQHILRAYDEGFKMGMEFEYPWHE
jgi:predicted acylesterase/phospholipase RssA